MPPTTMAPTTARAERPDRGGRRAAEAPALGLARQLRREGRADEAGWLYRDLTATTAEHARPARLELARLMRAQGRFRAALGLYDELVGAEPGNARAQAGRLDILRLLHRHADAEAEARRLAALRPNEPGLLLGAARLALAREAFPAALGWAELAFAAAPDRPESIEMLLEAQLSLARFPQAEAFLDALSAREPLAVRWRAARARVAEARGDLDAALRCWGEVLEVEGHSLAARLATGRLLTEAGRWRETVQIYRDLVQTHPRAAEPVVELARLSLRQGETAAALGWLARARDLEPGDDRLNRDIARVYAEEGNAAEAQTFARRLAEARPESPEPPLTRAWIEELSGDIPAAVATLRDTLREFPQSFAGALKLARLLEREGRPAEALDVLDAVRAVLPDCYGLELARVDLLFELGRADGAAEAIDALVLDHGARADLQKRIARLEVVGDRVEAARRRWARVARFDRHVAGPPVNLHRLNRRPLAPEPGEVRLFTRQRNQVHRLPWILDFYRGQGVGRFLVVDNGSDDGTRDYLLAQQDVHLWLTTDSYAEYGGGMRWLNELLALHGSGHWCLTVDVDEVLAFPHAERLGLKGLTRHLEGQGAEALFAFMLDLYPEGPVVDAVCEPGESPFPVCPLFDRSGHVTRPNPNFPFRMVVGGLMGRLLYAGRQDATYLHKVPLVRWRPDFRYTLSMHHLYPVRLAAEAGVLLHFKYLDDLPGKAAVEAGRKQYGHGGKRYTALNDLFGRDPALSLAGEPSERFRDTGQLVDLGLMRSSAALDALAGEVPASDRLPGWPPPQAAAG